MRVSHGREHLEDGTETHEVLGQTDKGRDGTTFRELLQEERQEGNHEDEEDTNDGTLDPKEDGVEVVATARAHNVLAVGGGTHSQLRVERTDEDHGKHEELHRENDEDVVDVETG